MQGEESLVRRQSAHDVTELVLSMEDDPAEFPRSPSPEQMIRPWKTSPTASRHRCVFTNSRITSTSLKNIS